MTKTRIILLNLLLWLVSTILWSVVYIKTGQPIDLFLGAGSGVLLVLSISALVQRSRS